MPKANVWTSAYAPAGYPPHHQGVPVVKNLPANVQSLGWEDRLEEDMATHSSILAWNIPWIEEPGGLQFLGLQRVGHNWSDLACTVLLHMPHEYYMYLFGIFSNVYS